MDTLSPLINFINQTPGGALLALGFVVWWAIKQAKKAEAYINTAVDERIPQKVNTIVSEQIKAHEQVEEKRHMLVVNQLNDLDERVEAHDQRLERLESVDADQRLVMLEQKRRKRNTKDF